MKGREFGELAMSMDMPSEGIERSALDCWDDILERLKEGTPVVFLDYDGTLTPIVEVPSKAVLSDSMRGTLHRLAKLCPVSLVSGRDLYDVRRKVGLDHVVYIGSHGFEVLGPFGHYVEEKGDAFTESLDRAESELRYAIGDVRGALVERKRFAVALHHRLVDSQNLPRLNIILENIRRRHPDLRVIVGKRAFELRPDMDWGRGRVTGLIIDMLHLGSTAVPLYIGDDIIDEDAFKAIGDRGITILVAGGERETLAQYVLSDVLEVQQLLEQLIVALEEE